MKKSTAKARRSLLASTHIAIGLLAASCAAPAHHQSMFTPAPESDIPAKYEALVGDDFTLDVDGVTRELRIHFPPNFSKSDKAPLIISMHGLTSNNKQMQLMTEMDKFTDPLGMITIYPLGLLIEHPRKDQNNKIVTHWNSHSFLNSKVDDVAFISTLIDEAIDTYNVDPDRVYITGMSNGGFMTYNLMCNIPEKIAAAASVTGVLPYTMLKECKQDHNIPLLHIHGTKDEAVPFEGVKGEQPSVAESIGFFRKIYECDDTPTSTEMPDLDPTDGTTVTHIVYENCKAGGAVESYTIHNGSHTWPGSKIVNRTPHSMDIDSSQIIVDFFKTKSRPHA